MGLIMTPKLAFPSLSLLTPVRDFPQARKRTLSETSLHSFNESKFQKTEESDPQSSSTKKTGAEFFKIIVRF